MSSVVYWFEGGKVLHTSARCPQLLRAFTAMEKARGMGPGRPKLRSCDMDASDSEGRQLYPPDELELCQVCPR